MDDQLNSAPSTSPISLHSQNCCTQLREELANQSEDFLRQRGALEAESISLRGRLEESQRERDGEPAAQPGCAAGLRRKAAVMVAVTRVLVSLQSCREPPSTRGTC